MGAGAAGDRIDLSPVKRARHRRSWLPLKVIGADDAMEVSAINPFKYLVVTRIMVCTVCLPLLMAYTALVGMMGSYLDIHLNE